MESWRHVWREGVAPLLSTASLEKLRDALQRNDPRLITNTTTFPPPLPCDAHWPCEGACPIGFCGWQGDGLNTVGEVEEFFARMCFEIDQRLGEPGGCRYFLHFVDQESRETMRLELTPEVDRVLAIRNEKAA